MKKAKKVIAIMLTMLTIVSICSAATTVFAAEYVEVQRRTEYFDSALSRYLKNIVDTENAVKISEKEEVEDAKNRENSTSEMSTFSLRGAQSTSAANALTREEVDVEHNILTLEMENGEKTAYIFSEPVSYLDGDGNLVYKDTIIVPVTESAKLNAGYTYQNSENDYKMYFGADSSVGVLLCSDLGSEIKLIPSGVNVAPGYVSSKTIDDIPTDTFEYDGVFGVSSLLRYFPQLNGCKEEIILSAYDGVSRFEFTLMTGNCIAAVNSSGQIEIIDENKNILDTLKVPYAYDSSGGIDMTSEHYADCTYELEKTDDGVYMLTLVVPEDFLTDESTVYPVVIDPTTSTKYMYRDASVYSKYPTNSSFYNNETNCFGKSSDYGFGRVYCFFNLPDDLENYATINSAYFWARETTGRTETMNVRPYIVNNTAWYNSMTWNTKPGYGDYTCSLKNINSNSSDGKGVYWYKFDIAKAVKAWTSGTTNRGIVFVSNTEINDAGYLWRAFASMENSTSSYRPYAIISYTNDTTKPVINSWSLSPSTWTTGNVTLTLNITEKDSCGNTSSYPFYTTYNNWSAEWKNSKSKEFSTSGAVAYVAVRDSAGNESNTITINIPIDKDPPTVSYSKNIADTTWTNDGVTVTVTASDALSRLHSTAYSYNGGSSWTSAKTYKYTANGSYTLKVRDAVGNTTTKIIPINNIDKGLPTATITSESTPLSSKVTVVGNDTLSGLHSTPYSFDNGSWQSSGTYITQDESVVIKVRDKANNIKTFTYDCPKTSVEVVPSVANDVWTKQNVRLTITGTGIAKYKFGDNPWQTSNYYDFSESGEAIIKIEDVNGYVSDAAIYSISNIDRSAPATPDIYEESGLVYIIPQDYVEGTASETVQYSLDGTNWVDYTDALDIVRTYGATVYARVIDEAGNESDVAELTLENNLGEYTASYSDIAFGEGLFPVGFDRTYTSTDGWFFTFDANVTKEDENTYIFTDFYGEKQYFIDSGDGKFESADESVLTVTKDENKTDTGYSLNYGDMVVEFGADRKLSKITTDYTTTEYTWNVDGTLRIANSLWAETDGAVVSFDEKDNPIEIKITRGECFRNVEYEWEYIPQEENEYITHLDSFTDAAGEIHTYSYVEGTEILTNNGTETITYANGRVRLIQQPNGAFVKYIYNDSAASLSNKTPGNIGAVTVKDSKGVIDTIYYSDGFEVTNSLDSYSDKAEYTPNNIESFLTEETTDTISGVAYVVEIPAEDGSADAGETSEGTNNESDEGSTGDESAEGENATETDTETDTETVETETPLYEEIDEDTYAFYSYDTNKRVTVELEVLKSNIPDINAATFESAEAVAESKVTYVYLSDEDDSITEQISYIKSQNGLVPDGKECYTYDKGNVLTHSKYKRVGENDILLYDESYTYDDYGNVKEYTETNHATSVDAYDVTYTTRYRYDIWNQCVETIVETQHNKEDGSIEKEEIATATEYDVLGRITAVEYDGETTSYTYEAGNIDTETTGDDLIDYGYNDGNLTEKAYKKIVVDEAGVKSEEIESVATYGYDDYGNLINHAYNGYNFTYNTLGSIVEAKVNDTVLVEYDYKGAEQELSYIDYKNGQIINYTYDETTGKLLTVSQDEATDDLLTVSQDETTKFSYSYSTVGKDEITTLTDSINNIIKVIENDKVTVKANADTILYSVENLYEDEKIAGSFNGKVITVRNTIDGVATDTVYTLKSEENKDSFYVGGTETEDFVKTYENDYAGNLWKVNTGSAVSTEYGYNENNNISSLINSLNGLTLTYGYGYDDNGNIIAENLTIAPETEDGSSDDGTNQAVSYDYDEKNQLTKATSSTTEWSYGYDGRGNITSKTEKNLTTGEETTYNYGYDSVWKDRLVSYNNEIISYEKRDGNEILAVSDPSNPLIYRGNELTWTMGRQLASYGSNTYTYNEEGIRTSKTVNGEKTTYYLDGTNIIEQRTGDTVLHFHYDSNDEIIGFTYNEADYFYVKNSMGDITGITDINGNLVASYTYDPWGKVLDDELTAIGELNPFRYRSYYYDVETELYYLQSRYYDPEVGRFINSDDVSFIGVTGSEISYNPFAYCENNPVNSFDPMGTRKIYIGWIWWFVDLLIIGIPMVGKINAALSKAGKAHSLVIKSLTSFISKYYNRFSSVIKKATERVVNKSLATQITSIVASGFVKALAMFTIFSSIGNFVQYVVDCLDGLWDNYLNTNIKWKFRLVWRRS